VAVPLSPRDRLIVALDLNTPRDAEAMVERLGDSVTFYKIGYQLAFAGGLSFADTLIGAGKRVFLDMKLHDIENTVAKGVENVARLGVTFLTIHAFPQTMKAAVAESGYAMGVDALVARRAQQAQEIGVDGLVCSAEEASPLRLVVGNDMLLVTPGIRPEGAAHGDQKRVTTPAQAIGATADYLVVGRPITAASDPKASAEAIVAEMTNAAK
jgi:orotidine-5'-phosphate decarboxylase